VKRPINPSRNSTKPKTSSSLRTSLAFDEVDTDAPIADIRRPKTSSKSSRDRVAETLRDRVTLPLRAGESDSRPSYNADYLAELKSSTPNTPANRSGAEDDKILRTPRGALDIASKFGADALITSHHDDTPSIIPSAAEIREKKERRQRLAKEQDFISLNDSGDTPANASDGSLSDDEFRPRSSLVIPATDVKSKYDTDTRLIPDDEDMYESFENFTEDNGKVALGRRAAKEQDKQRRKDIADQIRSAQHGYGYTAGVSDDSDDDDERDKDEPDQEEIQRNAAYEAAQTRAGTYSTGSSLQRERALEERTRRRFEIQPRVRQIPELKVVVGRFWEMVKAKEAEVEESKRRLERVARERVEMIEEEGRIKVLLKEAGERYEKLRGESNGQAAGEAVESGKDGNGTSGQDEGLARDAAPLRDVTPPSEEQSQDESASEEMQATGFSMGGKGGFGMGGDRSFAGMAAPRSAEDDW